jgi:hypothetical protein
VVLPGLAVMTTMKASMVITSSVKCLCFIA